jgi:glucose-1-phosphate cytidylyltransferase
MKAMILAGGFGSRLAEETHAVPKPMVEIGDKPILWHIMKIYEGHGITDFIVCLGYKADFVKQYFLNYSNSLSDFSLTLADGSVRVHSRKTENWTIDFIDTGLHTMTGGRIRRAIEALNLTETFCLTYGDGLSDVDVTASINHHKEMKKMCTVTAVQPPGRFGVMDIGSEGQVVGFREKVISDQHRINGGFFVVEPDVASLITSDETVWEDYPLRHMAENNQLAAFKHDGFWQPMDTLRDKMVLQEYWDSGNVPWGTKS